MWGVLVFLAGFGLGVLATLVGALVYIPPPELPATTRETMPPATARQLRSVQRADISVALARPVRPVVERRLPVIRSVDLAAELQAGLVVERRAPPLELVDLDAWDREDTHGD